MSADKSTAVTRLIGQHPAAIRAVRWQNDALGPDDLGHLEIETKHGQVVLFDHQNGAIYANPPSPAGTVGTRQQRDLTTLLAGAFDDRPVFTQIHQLHKDDRIHGWTFLLSTGARFSLTLDDSVPVLLTESPAD